MTPTILLALARLAHAEADEATRHGTQEDVVFLLALEERIHAMLMSRDRPATGSAPPPASSWADLGI